MKKDWVLFIAWSTIVCGLGVGIGGVWVQLHSAPEPVNYPPWYRSCPTEDSVDCIWDAQRQGDGTGRSFIAWPDGSITYLGGN